MKKTITKILTLGVLIVMSIGLFAGCGGNYKYQESDFNLTVMVNRTEARVGEEVEITATFKNLSGKNIRVRMKNRRDKKLEDLIYASFFLEGREQSFVFTKEGGSRPKITIKKGALVVKVMKFCLEESSNYEVVSAVFFNAGGNYKEAVAIYSKSTKIFVKE